jgi:hypothetical protein
LSATGIVLNIVDTCHYLKIEVYKKIKRQVSSLETISLIEHADFFREFIKNSEDSELNSIVKNRKARKTISLTEHSLEVTDMSGGISGPYKTLLTECYPFNEKGSDKNVYGQAFAEAYKRSVISMDELEKSLKSKDYDW